MFRVEVGTRHGLGDGARLPQAHQPHGQDYGERKDRERHDPRDAVEAGGGGRGQHGVAVLLHEALQDQRIAVAAREAGGKLIAHAVRVGAADVIAFQQNLIAAAHAHELMAQLVEARIGVSAQKDHGQQRNEDELRDAEFRVSNFKLQEWNTNFRFFIHRASELPSLVGRTPSGRARRESA